MKRIKNIGFIFLGLVFFSCENVVQVPYPEYYRQFREIEKHLDSGDIELAVSMFDKLNKQIPHVPSAHLYKTARICAENNYCDFASRYLKLAFINGKEYENAIRPNKMITTCKMEIDKILKQESEIHQQNFNIYYKAQIDSKFKEDQKARMKNDDTKAMFIDSMNMITLLSLIDKNGYPGEKIIGNNSASGAFIMLLHMDRDRNNKVFQPIIEKAYNEGQLWPRGFAWIADRRRAWGEDKLEPYYYHMPSKKYANFNEDQIKEINRRRDSIGLAPK